LTQEAVTQPGSEDDEARKALIDSLTGFDGFEDAVAEIRKRRGLPVSDAPAPGPLSPLEQDLDALSGEQRQTLLTNNLPGVYPPQGAGDVEQTALALSRGEPINERTLALQAEIPQVETSMGFMGQGWGLVKDISGATVGGLGAALNLLDMPAEGVERTVGLLYWNQVPDTADRWKMGSLTWDVMLGDLFGGGNGGRNAALREYYAGADMNDIMENHRNEWANAAGHFIADPLWLVGGVPLIGRVAILGRTGKAINRGIDFSKIPGARNVPILRNVGKPIQEQLLDDTLLRINTNLTKEDYMAVDATTGLKRAFKLNPQGRVDEELGSAVAILGTLNDPLVWAGGGGAVRRMFQAFGSGELVAGKVLGSKFEASADIKRMRAFWEGNEDAAKQIKNMESLKDDYSSAFWDDAAELLRVSDPAGREGVTTSDSLLKLLDDGRRLLPEEAQRVGEYRAAKLTGEYFEKFTPLYFTRHNLAEADFLQRAENLSQAIKTVFAMTILNNPRFVFLNYMNNFFHVAVKGDDLGGAFTQARKFVHNPDRLSANELRLVEGLGQSEELLKLQSVDRTFITEALPNLQKQLDGRSLRHSVLRGMTFFVSMADKIDRGARLRSSVRGAKVAAHAMWRRGEGGLLDELFANMDPELKRLPGFEAWVEGLTEKNIGDLLAKNNDFGAVQHTDELLSADSLLEGWAKQSWAKRNANAAQSAQNNPMLDASEIPSAWLEEVEDVIGEVVAGRRAGLPNATTDALARMEVMADELDLATFKNLIADQANVPPLPMGKIRDVAAPWQDQAQFIRHMKVRREAFSRTIASFRSRLGGNIPVYNAQRKMNKALDEYAATVEAAMEATRGTVRQVPLAPRTRALPSQKALATDRVTDLEKQLETITQEGADLRTARETAASTGERGGEAVERLRFDLKDKTNVRNRVREAINKPGITDNELIRLQVDLVQADNTLARAESLLDSALRDVDRFGGGRSAADAAATKKLDTDIADKLADHEEATRKLLDARKLADEADDTPITETLRQQFRTVTDPPEPLNSTAARKLGLEMLEAFDKRNKVLSGMFDDLAGGKQKWEAALSDERAHLVRQIAERELAAAAPETLGEATRMLHIRDNAELARAQASLGFDVRKAFSTPEYPQFSQQFAQTASRQQDFLRYASEHLDEAVRSTQGVPTELMAKARKFLVNDVHDAMRQRDLVINAHAQTMSDFVMLNYSRKYGIDGVLSLLFPYHFWIGRTARDWGRMTMARPGVTASFTKLYDTVARINEDAGVPERMKRSIRIPVPGLSNLPFFDDQSGDSIFFDPIRVLYPLAGFQDASNFNRGVELKPAGKVLDFAQQTGPGVNPFITLGLGATGILGDREAHVRRSMSSVTTSAPRVVRAAAEWMQGISHDPDPLVLTEDIKEALAAGEPMEEDFLKDALKDVWNFITEDGFDEFRANRMVSNLVASEPERWTPRDGMLAMKTRQGPLWLEATRRAQDEKGLRVLSGWLFAPLSIYPEGEETMRGLDAMWREVRDEDDPELVEKFFHDFPEYQVRKLAMLDRDDPETVDRELDTSLFFIDLAEVEGRYDQPIEEMRGTLSEAEESGFLETKEGRRNIKFIEAEIAFLVQRKDEEIEALEAVYPTKLIELSLRAAPRERALFELREEFFNIQRRDYKSDKEFHNAREAFIQARPAEGPDRTAWNELAVRAALIWENTEARIAASPGRARTLADERDEALKALTRSSRPSVSRETFRAYLDSGGRPETLNRIEYKRAVVEINRYVAIGETSGLSPSEQKTMKRSYWQSHPLLSKYYGDDEPRPWNAEVAAAYGRMDEIWEGYYELDGTAQVQRDYLVSNLDELNGLRNMVRLPAIKMLDHARATPGIFQQKPSTPHEESLLRDLTESEGQP